MINILFPFPEGGRPGRVRRRVHDQVRRRRLRRRRKVLRARSRRSSGPRSFRFRIRTETEVVRRSRKRSEVQENAEGQEADQVRPRRRDREAAAQVQGEAESEIEFRFRALQPEFRALQSEFWTLQSEFWTLQPEFRALQSEFQVSEIRKGERQTEQVRAETGPVGARRSEARRVWKEEAKSSGFQFSGRGSELPKKIKIADFFDFCFCWRKKIHSLLKKTPVAVLVITNLFTIATSCQTLLTIRCSKIGLVLCTKKQATN